MFKQQLLTVDVLSVLLTPPAFAQAIEQIPQGNQNKRGSVVTKIPRLSEIDRPATNIKDWLSQSSTLPQEREEYGMSNVYLDQYSAGLTQLSQAMARCSRTARQTTRR
ncbi:hypothetical protein [Nostoc sp.]|uniref:hypothetical protein n=1 Tax=Nostoc sp. TaxID=1180 RepID=UPI002FF49384